MDGPSFENWFGKVLPTLEDNAVIVLDNATYHSRKKEKVANSSSNKAVIKQWLNSKNIPFQDDTLKAELLVLVNEQKKKYNAHIIDEIAAANGKTVLRLPPYHCELNPIELIWAQIKGYVASKNTTFKFAGMKVLFEEAMAPITAEMCSACRKN